VFVIRLRTLSATDEPLVAKDYNTNGNAKGGTGTDMYRKSMRLPISATNYRLNRKSCMIKMSAFGSIS
jgi:hypothetical protein